MHVLHVIPSLALRDGGPSVALPLMARALVGVGCRVTIATTAAAGAAEVPPSTIPGQGVPRPEATYHFFSRQTSFYKFSWPLTRWLNEHAREFDVIHIHALFSYSSVAAARAARAARVPYVVRPLGVLNRWGMENRRRWIKGLSLRFVEMPILRGAAAIHYTSKAEQCEAAEAEVGIDALPSAVIPLGIETTAYARLPGREAFCARFPQAAGREVVLFLSRVDEKKGLDLLLAAFARVRSQHPEALLVIAGDGDTAYLASLRARAGDLGIAGDVLWTGFLAGADKLAALAAATVFALPSYSENFGVAAAEALAAGVPSVLSERVAIAPEANAAGAAVVVPCEAGALAGALARLLAEPETRARLSDRARLAAERYSLNAAGTRLAELYRSIASTRI